MHLLRFFDVKKEKEQFFSPSRRAEHKQEILSFETRLDEKWMKKRKRKDLDPLVKPEDVRKCICSAFSTLQQEKEQFFSPSRRAEQRSAVYTNVHEHRKRKLDKEGGEK